MLRLFKQYVAIKLIRSIPTIAMETELQRRSLDNYFKRFNKAMLELYREGASND